MVFGYSDQAPAFLRELTISLDALFGSPVWEFLNPAGEVGFYVTASPRGHCSPKTSTSA